MGIDIYARWKGQTEAEKEAQYTGFSVTHGHVGYLREAYHGGPYVTEILVAEAFDAEDCEAQIPAALMRERLLVVIDAALIRAALVYNEALAHGDRLALAAAEAFCDFVDLCEQKEAETGEPCTIEASY